MNGDQLAGSMKRMPATITNSTMKSFTRDQHHVHPQRLLDPEGHESAEEQHEEDREDVDGSAVPDLRRDLDAELRQQRPEVRAPALGDHARTEEHLEDEVPPDDPGEELAERRVRERVGRSRDRHGRRELRVAERGEGAGDGRDDEADDDRGSGDLVGRSAGEREDARSDHHADPEDREVERAERFLEPELRFLGVGYRLFDGLRAQNAHSSRLSQGVDR